MEKRTVWRYIISHLNMGKFKFKFHCYFGIYQAAAPIRCGKQRYWRRFQAPWNALVSLWAVLREWKRSLWQHKPLPWDRHRLSRWWAMRCWVWGLFFPPILGRFWWIIIGFFKKHAYLFDEHLDETLGEKTQINRLEGTNLNKPQRGHRFGERLAELLFFWVKCGSTVEFIVTS